MSDIVERLRDLRFRNDLQDEAADTIEALRRERDGLKNTMLIHDKLFDAHEAELAAMTAERDTFYMDYRMKCDAETKALYGQLAAMTAKRPVERKVRNHG